MLAEAVVELNDKVNSVTNHSPTVVTVTNECTRQHCPEPGQAVHEPCNNVSCQKCWPRNKWLGDGKIVTNDAGGVEK